MSTSQNGWPVITSGTDSRLVAIPKIIGRVRKGDVATVFTYLVDRIDREVEDVDAGRDDWGYAYRAVRGATSGYSNHASGTALDINATRHVLGRVGTWGAVKTAKIRAILRDLDGVVRWGGDYTGRRDEMHFEINASAARVKAAAAKILGTAKPVSNPSTPAPRPPASTTRKPRSLPPAIKRGATGGWVGLWQSILRTQGENVTVDGDFGPGTDAATRRVQRRWGLTGDGSVGPRTWLRALISDKSGALTYGDKGPQVELLQNVLGIKLDRSFGAATRDAVRQMQRYLRISADGSAGPGTYAALRKHYKA